MKIPCNYEIKPGEIWAVAGVTSAARSIWCSKIAQDEDISGHTALLNFAQQADEAEKTGWPQARYHAEDGETVAEFLSFNSVYDVNPFEVGARYPETRKAYRKRQDFLMHLLDLRRLKDRPVIALSNGENRRVLLARALAKKPRLLVLDDPAGGLDERQRLKLRDVIAALAKRGLAVIFAYRHVDELPPGITKWLAIDAKGKVRTVNPLKPRQRLAKRGHGAMSNRQSRQGVSPAVIEISNLNVEIGGKNLFNGLSWTVRKGERWILHGENGCGKTALFALITGDSPLAYAADIKVFGIPRDTGAELAKVRRRIGMASPEMQAFLGLSPDELLDRALKKRHELLLLDEPFMNMDAESARRAARRIERHLRANPDTTAILICHRRDEAPYIFDREIFYDATTMHFRVLL